MRGIHLYMLGTPLLKGRNRRLFYYSAAYFNCIAALVLYHQTSVKGRGHMHFVDA